MYHLHKNRSLDNICTSPEWVRQVLATVYLGTKGTTRENLEEGLMLRTVSPMVAVKEFQDFHNKLTEGHVIFSTGSFVFGTEGKSIINGEYLKKTENVFKTVNRKAISLDEKCLCSLKYFIWPKVNHFIHTPRVGPNIEDTKVGVVNTIYFRGYWKYPFETIQYNDQLERNSVLRYMSATGKMAYEYNAKLRALMVSIPFKESDYSMLIIIQAATPKIEEIEVQLKDIDLLRVARDKKKLFELMMPNMKFNFEMDLNDFIYKEMNIQGIFENWRDFSSLSNKKLLVQSITHKTRIVVNPRKMEVASVNVVQFDETPKGAYRNSEYEQRSRIRDAEKVKLNRPFHFAVRNREKIFFVGTIKNFNNII
ncbi:serpin I2-like [Scaptodrosophila lebanonensis]|uniref:Serpin I2-like n=1 Tax=Drosophila lebanonensis TaxID=7225 RepID=A0A6J2TQ84_DROLE|nr:serpin I2-like [Scaptodrosophila lebanonensis]